MGHLDKVRKLGRTKPHREAMLNNMMMSLFTHRLIKTTDAKAKALRPVVDRLIRTAKKGTLASKRAVAKSVKVKSVFVKLYSEILPGLEDRNSGYTRVIKMGVRRGDSAPMSVVELLTPVVVKEPETGKKKSRKAEKEEEKSSASAK